MESFEAWYRGAHPKVSASLVVAFRDRELVADVTQEAFIKAYVRWARVSRMGNPTGWVYRVARNHLVRQSRHRTRETPAHQPAEPSHEDATITDPQFWAAIRALPDRQREAIALRYIADLTQAEVAQAMGIRPGTAAATLAAARKTLATTLAQEATL